MIVRTVATAACVLVAIIVTPYALVPVANTADAVVVAAILGVPGVWLIPSAEAKPPRRRRPVSPYLDADDSRLDRLERDGLAQFQEDVRAARAARP